MSDTYSVDNLLVLVAALVDFDEGEVVKLPLGPCIVELLKCTF